MKKLMALVALLLVSSARVEAASVTLWCSSGYGREAILVDNRSVTVLYVKGDKPRIFMDKYQAFIGSIDPNDLRGTEVWIIEDRLFRQCKSQKLPNWIEISGKEGRLIETDTLPVPSPK